MNNVAKILGSVAIAGVIAAGSSAFTAGGLSTSTGADRDNFVGGKVSQTIEGAQIDSVVYTYAAPVGVLEYQTITGVTLDFATDVADRTVTVDLGTGSAFTCTVAVSPGDVASCTGGSAAVASFDEIDIRVTA